MIDYMCEGCNKVKDLKCAIFPTPPMFYIRKRCCPFNYESRAMKKERIRVGQQKQRKRR